MPVRRSCPCGDMMNLARGNVFVRVCLLSLLRDYDSRHVPLSVPAGPNEKGEGRGEKYTFNDLRYYTYTYIPT